MVRRTAAWITTIIIIASFLTGNDGRDINSYNEDLGNCEDNWLKEQEDNTDEEADREEILQAIVKCIYDNRLGLKKFILTLLAVKPLLDEVCEYNSNIPNLNELNNHEMLQIIDKVEDHVERQQRHLVNDTNNNTDIQCNAYDHKYSTCNSCNKRNSNPENKAKIKEIPFRVDQKDCHRKIHKPTDQSELISTQNELDPRECSHTTKTDSVYKRNSNGESNFHNSKTIENPDEENYSNTNETESDITYHDPTTSSLCCLIRVLEGGFISPPCRTQQQKHYCCQNENELTGPDEETCRLVPQDASNETAKATYDMDTYLGGISSTTNGNQTQDDRSQKDTELLPKQGTNYSDETNNTVKENSGPMNDLNSEQDTKDNPDEVLFQLHENDIDSQDDSISTQNCCPNPEILNADGIDSKNIQDKKVEFSEGVSFKIPSFKDKNWKDINEGNEVTGPDLNETDTKDCRTESESDNQIPKTEPEQSVNAPQDDDENENKIPESNTGLHNTHQEAPEEYLNYKGLPNGNLESDCYICAAPVYYSTREFDNDFDYYNEHSKNSPCKPDHLPILITRNQIPDLIYSKPEPLIMQPPQDNKLPFHNNHRNQNFNDMKVNNFGGQNYQKSVSYRNINSIETPYYYYNDNYYGNDIMELQ